jgi:TatD DNase family protein
VTVLIDAHAHLDQYDDALVPLVLAELEAQRVLTISVAVDPPSYARAQALAARSRWIVPTFGIHPWRAPHYHEQLESLQPLLDHSPMLGEIGLDYHWVEDRSTFPAQRAVLEHFLRAAREQQKIVNLHTKGAEMDILELLHTHRVERAIVHWYSGPLDVAAALAERGACFTIGVELHTSALVQELARHLPTHLLLTETDNPGGVEWLTGEVGMPHHLPPIIAALAELRGVEPEELRATVRANLRRLLGDDPRLATVAALVDGDGTPPVQVVVATRADIPAWRALAREVEPLFGPMVGDPAFERALERAFDSGRAFCVREGGASPSAALLGGMLVSTSRAPTYSIGWLAVSEGARRQGVGRALVEHAFRLIAPPATVEVVTFTDEQPGGAAARRFYEALGFVAAEVIVWGPEALPRQVFRSELPIGAAR